MNNKEKRFFVFTRAGEILISLENKDEVSYENGIALENEKYFSQYKNAFFFAADPDGSNSCFALLLPEGAQTPFGFKAVRLRSVIHNFYYNRALRMYHLAEWRENSQFCGACGALTKDADSGEYALVCPRCGKKIFPRISPAVLVLVKNKRDEVLLAHNVNFRNNVYSLIAGFVEAGENLENAVVREVREEVSLEVDNVKFITSQNWPFPDSLMVGFEAEYSGGKIICDKKEILDARWFSRSTLPDLPGHGSVSRYMIDRWLAGEG